MMLADLMEGWEIFKVRNGQDNVERHIGYHIPGSYSGKRRYVSFLIDEEMENEISLYNITNFSSKLPSLEYTEVDKEWIVRLLPVNGRIEDLIRKGENFQSKWNEIETIFIENYDIQEKWLVLWNLRYAFKNGYQETVMKMIISSDVDIKKLEKSKIVGMINVQRKAVSIETNEIEEQRGFRLSKTFINPLNEGKNTSVGKNEYVCAAIQIKKWANYDDYFEAVRKGNRKGAAYPAKRAAREGYYCRRFEWSNHIPDVAEINFSKEERTGKKMTDSYKRSVEELGGAPEKKEILKSLPNSKNWWVSWGVFKFEEGHMQGEVQTNERLVGYIGLTREGDLCAYGTILGHGDHLRFGIMYLLHFQIMKSIIMGEDDYFNGIEYLAYADFLSGTRPDAKMNTLIPWKMKLLFEPFILHSITDSMN